MDSRLVLPANTILDGKYRILRVVGAGVFSIIYEAEDMNLGTTVAIKEYYPLDFGNRDNDTTSAKSDPHKQTFEWGRSNFLQEARTLARFEHPNIAGVLRVFEANSTAYMVLRFENGQNFEQWLAGLGRLPTQEELDRITAPLLDALAVIHAAKFLHRGITPSNIMVRMNGTSVLIHFAAARPFADKTRPSMTGMVTAGYSPHEQYSSDGSLQGPWSDIYALGGTLYRAVCGKPPVEAALRLDDDRMVQAAFAAKGKYRTGFLAAIDSCLNVLCAERPQSIAELRPRLLWDDFQRKRTKSSIETTGTRTSSERMRGSGNLLGDLLARIRSSTPKSTGGKIFISYRRDDTAGFAGRAHDRLEQEFGRDVVFMDVDAIPLGVDFAKMLREAVAECDVLLAVIGTDWLDVRDEDGRRRLDDPNDFVRIEIEAALERGIPVIPLLFDGARMPRAELLPGELKHLTRRNGLDVRHRSFHADMDKLVQFLRKRWELAR